MTAATGLPAVQTADVTRYWWGQTISTFGCVFTAIALPVVAVVYLNASAAQVGAVSAAATAPVLLFGLPAGALADRITRPRRALVLLDLASAVTIGAVALGLALHIATIAWLGALAVVLGMIFTLASTLYFVHLTQLVGRDAIGPTRARLQSGQYGAALLGRLLAGPAVAVLGAGGALSVNVASYLLSAVALVAMRSPDRVIREPGKGLWHAVRSAAVGLGMFRTDPFHRALAGFIFVPAAAMAGVAALTAPFLLRDLHIPPVAYGWMFAVSGLLGLAGSAAAARVLVPGRSPWTVALSCFTVAKACTLLLPLAGGPFLVAAGCAVLAIGLPAFFGALANVALTTTLMTRVGTDTLGRTMAALQMMTAAAGLTGALAGGALGDLIGVRATLWTLVLSALTVVVLALPRALSAGGSVDESAGGSADGSTGVDEGPRPVATRAG